MIKDRVLTILMQETNYISGEKISKQLGVSRTAVNKAIKALRQEGYIISSFTNKGYLLNTSITPDRLTYGELHSFIPTERMETVLYMDSTASTNKKLREMAFEGALEGQVVIANEQTCGRGRLGKSFFSPKNKGIYLSMLLKPNKTPSEYTTLTACTAVAVCNAIENVCNIRPAVKWVNDLLLNNKKVCGILTEMSVEYESGHIQYIIIGIGLNVNELETDFPKELKQAVTSLYEQTGQTFLRAKLIAEIIKELDTMRNSFSDKKESYLSSYRKDSIVIGKKVEFFSNNTLYSGTVLEINDDFSLKIKYDNGNIKNLSSGTIKIIN